MSCKINLNVSISISGLEFLIYLGFLPSMFNHHLEHQCPLVFWMEAWHWKKVHSFGWRLAARASHPAVETVLGDCWVRSAFSHSARKGVICYTGLIVLHLKIKKEERKKKRKKTSFTEDLTWYTIMTSWETLNSPSCQRWLPGGDRPWQVFLSGQWAAKNYLSRTLPW